MLRATVPNACAYCNVARGLSRIASAILPDGIPALSLAPVLPGTFTTTYRAPQASPELVHGALAVDSPPALHGSGQTSRAPERLSARLVEDLSSASYQQGRQMRQRAVPANRVARVAGFTSLFLRLGWEKLAGEPAPGGGLLSTSGHQRIVDTLCRMRGAVLKLGQMLSIQDASTVPAHVTALFEKVRDQAFAMPENQLNAVLTSEFDSETWRDDLFTTFNDLPIAAASIGQVHYAKLHGPSSSARPADWKEGQEVAVKVQYPGVAQSIDSDVANLKLLMSLNILPPGMFVDSILQELRNELSMECQYSIEASKQVRYGQLVASDDLLHDTFYVPRVFEGLSTDQVLVTEFVHGVPIDQVAKRSDVPQDYCNHLMDKMFRLTLRELFTWNFMQTDPNYANFLFDAANDRVNLLDFGAAREYDADYVSDYLDVVAAAAREDREVIIEKSIALGFLTGREVKEMLDAHVSSVMVLGKPFRDPDHPFDFSAQNLPKEIQSYVPTMVRLRLRPPATPIYSLHRRLSGTILMATKFRATIPSGATFWSIYEEEQAKKAAKQKEGEGRR